ncbi:MAG: lysophospholipid acyltransferase family protein [Bacteroidota bacterium]|nr:lysophospholipid acyltransferase family protein [Bacteroidota bacterium]
MKTKKVFPTKWYVRILIYIYFAIFIFFYRIKIKMPSNIKKLKGPYLFLSNHVGYWDPFIAGLYLPEFTHFVSSDASFRNKFQRFFLNSFGAIPKKKNIRDTKVIRDIISVIKQGENVGLFPEAVRNWSGSSFPIDNSISKLIKLLKVPVVVSVMKGMNLFNPRWSTKLRRTKIEIDYTLLLTKEQIVSMSDDEVYEKLMSVLTHDEVEYQRTNMNKVHSKYKAENINHTLFLCPECNTIDSFRAEGNDFYCSKCNYDIHINDYSFFERKSEGKLVFDNIRDWYYWQEKWLLDYVTEKVENKFADVIFEDKNSKIFHSDSELDLSYIGNADIKLFIDRIEIHFIENTKIVIMNYADLQTINPQVNEMLEIFYDNEAYRVIGSRKGVSALKWEVAVNAIWKKIGMLNKLSPYIG